MPISSPSLFLTCRAGCALFLLLVSAPQAARIVGYFTNWGIYGNNPYTPQMIPYQDLTHIQYAFFKPEIDGRITAFDAWADSIALAGEMDWSTGRRDTATSLLHLARAHGVRVLPSVGGWTGSTGFPPMAASAETRARFCHEARLLIEGWGFDGIDIDWEYPGYTAHNGTPQDAQNFVTLLAQLRDTLNAMGGDKLITLAIAGGSGHGAGFLVEQFHPYVDFISIMSYDYTGIWDAVWHNSPLDNYGSNSRWSVRRAMEYYVARGVPKAKLNTGSAFYGRTFANCPGGLGATCPTAGPGEPGEAGMIGYRTVVAGLAQGIYTRHWDAQAQVPYATNAAGDFIAYDDTVSLRLKAEYVRDEGFGGTIIWELSLGTLPSGEQPLLRTLAAVLLDGQSTATIARPSLQAPTSASLRGWDLNGRPAPLP